MNGGDLLSATVRTKEDIPRSDVVYETNYSAVWIACVNILQSERPLSVHRKVSASAPENIPT